MKKSENLAGRIAEVRADSGLDRVQFGLKIGVGKRYIYMLEEGKRNPSFGLLLAMCYRFKCSEKWLVGKD